MRILSQSSRIFLRNIDVDVTILNQQAKYCHWFCKNIPFMLLRGINHEITQDTIELSKVTVYCIKTIAHQNPPCKRMSVDAPA